MKRIDEILDVPDPLAGLTPAQIEERDQKILAERDAEQREERRHEWERRKQSLIDRGLSVRHLREVYDGKLQTTPALAAIDKLPSSGLFCLSGPAGCGKTLAAHAWLLGYPAPPTEWKSSVRMTTAAEFARTSRYDENKFSVLAEPRRLVLDDVGVEYADNNASFLVDLDELLDLRWRSEKPTLLTTNLTEENFRKRYRERICDRLKGPDRWINCKHPSMRGTT